MNSYQIPSPYFNQNTLTLEVESFFKGPVLKLNGQELKLKRGKIVIRDDNYAERNVSLSSNLVEYAVVKIDNEKFYPMGRLQKHEKLFVLLPLGLIGIGGAVGGGLGAFAAYTNILLMREYKGSPIRFFWTLLTTVLAAVVWILLSVLVQSLMGNQ